MTSLFNRRGILFLVAGILAALMLFAACGGGDDDDDTGDHNSPTATEDGGDASEDPTDGSSDDPTEEPTEVSGGDGGSSAGDVDSCSLLEDDEIEAATGATVDGSEPTQSGDFFDCDWDLNGGLGYLNVSVLTGDDVQLEEYYSLTQDAEEIDGIGKKAQYDGIIGAETLLDDYEVTVSMFIATLEDADKREASIALLRKVVDRLE